MMRNSTITIQAVNGRKAVYEMEQEALLYLLQWKNKRLDRLGIKKAGRYNEFKEAEDEMLKTFDRNSLTK